MCGGCTEARTTPSRELIEALGGPFPPSPQFPGPQLPWEPRPGPPPPAQMVLVTRPGGWYPEIQALGRDLPSLGCQEHLLQPFSVGLGTPSRIPQREAGGHASDFPPREGAWKLPSLARAGCLLCPLAPLLPRSCCSNSAPQENNVSVGCGKLPGKGSKEPAGQLRADSWKGGV